MKLWQKNKELDHNIESFTVGNDYILDQHLVYYDCLASIAHVEMLGSISILSEDEMILLVSTLKEIIELDEGNQFIIKKEDEDCHTAIENYLTEKCGDVGKKIHTARSRNDQVLTALRLYCKDNLQQCVTYLKQLKKEIKYFSRKNSHIVFPGYTHMRKAMPSSIKMWCEAFLESLEDNLLLINAAYTLIDQNPLGSGAGYGVPLAINRTKTTEKLGFSKIQNNPIYTQLSRGKFESTIIHALTQIMADLNKMATDLILFSMSEFGYFQLPEELCTGSSIMPQKKNPDVLELVRAHYHTILSHEFHIKSTISNLMSGYNRDLQLTKEPLMNSFKITFDCLSIMTLVFEKLRVDKQACEKAMINELYATKEVYDLVKKGISFRDAYKKVGANF